MFRFGDPGGRLYGAVGTANANLLALWTSIAVGGSVSVGAGRGRTSGSSLLWASAGATSTLQIRKILDAQPTWGLAFAMKTNVLPNNTTRLSAFTDGASLQVELNLLSDGTLTVTRNFGAIAGATSGAGAVAPNVWNHIEWKVKIDPSAGTIYVAVNGVPKINLTGQNTRNTANSSANSVYIGWLDNPNIIPTVDWDDVIVYDGQATDANGLADITGPLGDCGLACLFPTGAGATTQFTPDTGSNWARVSETTPDGDTSYVESSTIGQIDTYAMADLPGAATGVKSLAQVFFARKTDVGARGMKGVVRSGGVNFTHATEISLGNSYAYAWSTWGQNPGPSSPVTWTVAAVNSLEAGQTVSS